MTNSPSRTLRRGILLQCEISVQLSPSPWRHLLVALEGTGQGKAAGEPNLLRHLIQTQLRIGKQLLGLSQSGPMNVVHHAQPRILLEHTAHIGGADAQGVADLVRTDARIGIVGVDELQSLPHLAGPLLLLCLLIGPQSPNQHRALLPQLLGGGHIQ